MVLADLLDSALRGVLLAALSVALGGMPWSLWVLRGLPAGARDVARDRSLRILTVAAVGLALCQAALLALKAFVLSDSLGPGALAAFALTVHFAAGIARVLLALALAATARGLRATPAGRALAPETRARWVRAVVLTLLLAGSGAWLTHAAGRLEHRGWLMTLTVVHQLAAGVWVGGLVQMLGFWRLARRRPGARALWPVVAARFSRLALWSVVALVLAAAPLAWVYTGSLSGLTGTGYGSLLVTKALLLGAALMPAAFSLAAARGAASAALRARLPYLVEVEAIVLVMILFAASALSAQPPAADVPAAEQATAREVAEVFRPKVPTFRTPSVETMQRDRVARARGSERSRDAYLWSNFSHNVAGTILLGMSLWALAGLVTGARWGPHWPLGFLALAAFIALRAAANEGMWPFGTRELRDLDAEAIQHAIAALLVVALGLLEWRARAGRRPPGLLAYVFPVLGAAGGILLLVHSHAAFQLKSSYLVQVTHSTMGALAGLMVAARWLELRLPSPWRRAAGAAAALALLAIALVLVFYREANVVVR